MNANLPKALVIWNEMNFAQRAEIMGIVGAEKSIAKTFKKCLAYIDRTA